MIRLSMRGVGILIEFEFSMLVVQLNGVLGVRRSVLR